MIRQNYKIRRYSTKTNKWDILELTKKEYLDFLYEKYRLPGEYKLDSRVKVFLEAKESFIKNEYYCDYEDDTVEYDEFWEEEGYKCVHGVLVDEFFITGCHYMYVNYLQINDKVKGLQFFPDFWDSDMWFFYCIDIAQLTDKDLVVTKKRQWGSSFKLAAYAIRMLWFDKSKVCKIFNVDQSYVEDLFGFMDDYKQFLNEHTGWYREFSPEEKIYWKQQQEVSTESSKGKKTTKKGRKNVVKGVTTQKKPSAIVSGACALYIAEEAGKNPTLDKSYNFAQKAMRFGNIKTGFFIASGAVGSMSECEPLKKFMLNPKANGFLEFPNIWSNRPDQMVGMFVPEYYSYGDCIDEWGNSLIEEAIEKIDEWLETIKDKSVSDYLQEVSQAPKTLEEAFSSQEINPFPKEIIQPQYDKVLRNNNAIPITIYVDKEGKYTHKLGSQAPPVRDFPIKKDTDKRGCVEMLEPPIENPPLNLYYGSCDPVTQIKTDTSFSLQSFGIYRADYYENGVLIRGKRVAWYYGRYDNVDLTYEICRDLMKYYNARTMIESDKDGFIRWLIKEKENIYLMKRSEYPRLQEIMPKSKIHEDYGIRKGSSKIFEDHLLESIIRYVTEEIGVDYDDKGNSIIRYGVERVEDLMLLKEMLEFSNKGNFDKIWEFAYGLDVAEGNTIRQHIVKLKEKVIRDYPKLKINQFNNYSYNKKTLKIKQF